MSKLHITREVNSELSESRLITTHKQTTSNQRPLNHPVEIPKLSIGRLADSHARQLPRTRSQLIQSQGDESIRLQARSILFQGRLDSIRFLSPKDSQQKMSSLAVSHRQHMLNDGYSADLRIHTDRSRNEFAQTNNLEQQLKIRTIECEGLKAQLMLDKAKYQTEMLLSERRMRRLQQQLGNVSDRIVEQKCVPNVSNTRVSPDHALSKISSTRSLRRFEKVDLKSQEGSIHHQQMGSVSEIQLKISKLKEMEQLQKRTAQSLFKIVDRIRCDSDNGSSRLRIIQRSKDLVDIGVETDRPQKDVNLLIKNQTGIVEEEMIRSDVMTNWTVLQEDNYAAIKEENSRMQAEIMCGYETIQAMRLQLAEYQQSMEATNDSLLKNNKQLEQDRIRLMNELAEKDIYIKKLSMGYDNLKQSGMGQHNTDLAREIEILQYENFALKTKIEELNDACRALERRQSEEKFNMEKKLTHLYGLIQKMKLQANQFEQEKQKLEVKLQQLALQDSSLLSKFACNSAQTWLSPLDTQSGNINQEEILRLKSKIKQQEDEIQDMCNNITELESDLLEKDRELGVYRIRHQGKKSPYQTIKEQYDKLRNTIQELEVRLIRQEELKVNQMHNSFSREQQYISRITELEQMVFNLNQDIDTLDRYRSELQQTCEEMGYSLETLKDTNEKLYTEATSLSVQKSELEEKLICRERALSRIQKRYQRKNSNSTPIQQEQNKQDEDCDKQYSKLIRQLKGYLKQIGRLSDQLLSDNQKRQVLEEMNRVNELFQTKLIQINFSPEFKKSMWDSLQIKEIIAQPQNRPQNEEESRVNEQVDFIRDFLERSEQRNSFCQIIERRIDSVIDLKESQLAGIIFRFLSNLFQHPNHEYLFERIDYLLTEAREYENHIDNKFRILEKSIGEYLNQAHAVFNIDDETERGKSIKQSDSHKGEEMQQRQIKSPIDALQIQASEAKQQELLLEDQFPQINSVNNNRVRSEEAEPESMEQAAKALKRQLLKQAHARIRQQRKKTVDQERKEKQQSTRRQSSIK